MNETEKQELLGKLKKEQLLRELNDLNKGLTSYKRRQEKYMKIKFSEGQKKHLDALRLRLRSKYHWSKETIFKYGGDVSIKIIGIDWDVFVYSLRSLNMNLSQFTALDKAINVVTEAIRKVESIPTASTDWRDISVTPRPKNQAEEANYLFDAMHLHPRVAEASRSLFKDKHYWDAIFRAFTAVNNFVKEKSGLSPSERRRMKDRQLMAKVFDENAPLIKLNKLVTDSNMNEQEGFRFLFMGATVGIRNPKAHDNLVQTDPYRTLEYLGLASLLMKRVEEGRVVEE